MDEAVASALDDDSHYIAKLAVNLTRGHHGTIIGDAPVRPELFVPGTKWARTGVLTTMVELKGFEEKQGSCFERAYVADRPG